MVSPKPITKNKKGQEHQKGLVSPVTLALLVAVAGVGLVFTGSPFNGPGYGFQVFTEVFTESMCQKYHEDIVTLKEKLEKAEEKEPEAELGNKDEEKLSDSVVSMGSKPKPTRYSKLSSRSNYNAEKAIAKRKKHLAKKCQEFADVMTPSSMMTDYLPKSYTYHVHSDKRVAICGIKGVGTNFYRTLVLKNTAAQSSTRLTEAFQDNLSNGLKLVDKKVIIVRHPFERLVTAYRANFAAYYDAKLGKDVPAKAGFPEFVDVVTSGYEELAKFMDENKAHGQSLGLDTSMVDGVGISSWWNPYWAACGVCNPLARPNLILDANHLDKDLPILWEALGGQETARKMVETKHEFTSSNEEVLQHYYSQVSKADIRKLAQKYQTDMELFGYDPEYFINMGTGE